MSTVPNEELDSPPESPRSEASEHSPTTNTSLGLFQLDLDLDMGNKSSKVNEADMMSAVLGVIEDVNAEEKRRADEEKQERQFVEEHMKRQKYLNRHSWKKSIFGGGVASWGLNQNSSFRPHNKPPTYPTKSKRGSMSSIDLTTPPTQHQRRSTVASIDVRGFEAQYYPSPPSSPKQRRSRVAGLFPTLNEDMTISPRDSSFQPSSDDENVPLGHQVRRASMDTPRGVHQYGYQSTPQFQSVPTSFTMSRQGISGPPATMGRRRRTSMVPSANGVYQSLVPAMSAPILIPQSLNMPPPPYHQSLPTIADDDHMPLGILVNSNQPPRTRRRSNSELPKYTVNPEPTRRSVSFDRPMPRDDTVPLGLIHGRRSLDSGTGALRGGKPGYVAEWLRNTTIPEAVEE
ncbi:hypothetical protein HK097_005657 [Rhizophlyctis rosea]|uniref:Uncharacterized protein n=1 Tax=Rhizophlyctis rosea TaxID=64517 RepID=A0AAD5SES9_9FUNG|nr:hypothetical protein HK097_005657 [Rhizophlyctis rosea]